MQAAIKTESTGFAFVSTTSVKDLRRALPALGKVVGRSSIPILECVILRSYPSGILATGTDLEAILSVDFPGSYDSFGDAVVNLADLRKTLTGAKAGDSVTIESTGDSVSVTIGGMTHKLAARDPADWPDITTVTGPTRHVDAGELASILADCAAAMSDEVTRYYLNGIALQRGADGNLVAVATNGHVLHKVETEIAWPVETDIIVPRLAVTALLHVLKTASGDMSITIGEKHVDFIGDGFHLTSKTIDGTFPDWERAIPQVEAGDFTVSLKVAETLAALAPATKGKSPAVELDFRGLKIRKVGDDASYECPLPQATEGVQYHPALSNVGVNARYLSEILRRFPADGIADIRIQADAKGHGPLRVECPERPDFLAVLMTMRI